MDNKQMIRGNRNARQLALQALYQWHMSHTDLAEIEIQLCAVNKMEKVNVEYLRRLLYGIPTSLTQLEATFSTWLDRPINQLNPIELTVLRISTFELLHCLEIPYRVILDESVNLTKKFGSQDGYKYVNGILNKVAKEVRSVEK